MKHYKKASTATALIAIFCSILVFAACKDVKLDSACAADSDGCPCIDNSCATGLQCINDRCVKIPDITDGDTNDGDMTDSDATDGDIVDRDKTDLIRPDGDSDIIDKEPDLFESQVILDNLCIGICDSENPEYQCINNDELCACDKDTGEKVVMNCNEICMDAGYCGSEECGKNDSGYGVCWCMGCRCSSDQDCISWWGKDYCINMGGDTICVDRCDIALCDKNTGSACVDIGRANGCGICWDKDQQNETECSIGGEACENNQYCSNICGGLSTASCYETCEAIPNTCATGELCFPLYDHAGIFIDGICGSSSANCPTCIFADGDSDAIDSDTTDSDAIESDTAD